MTILIFLAAWTLRSAVVVLTAALLLKLFCVKDPAVRLAGWTVALFGSLLIPVLTMTLPAARLPELAGWQTPAAVRGLDSRSFVIPPRNTQLSQTATSPVIANSSELARWRVLLLVLYCLGATVLLLRLITGLLFSRRLIGRSRPTGLYLPGGPIHDSSELAVPAALGVFRPLVVLPQDWREWDALELKAILAHEQSHVRRCDPAVQLLSAMHRALLWYSPLSWWMHNRIIRLAEEASDDAALAATKDRVSYAEMLLQFVQRGMKVAHWEGVAMARYGKADERIHRILDGTTISRGLTRIGVAAILLLGAPVIFMAAAAVPAQSRAPRAPKAAVAPVVGAQSTAPPVSNIATSPSAPPTTPQAPQASQPAAHVAGEISRYLIVSGDSSTGSWDSRDEPRFKEWRSKYGSNFAWFRQDGRDYIVNDEHTLAEFREAMAPQLEVNQQQDEVNRHQAAVNRLQEGVSGHQADVNRAQADVNQQQSLVNRGAGTQSRVNQLQSEVNGKQLAVNAEQAKVNQEQSIVNKEQDKVNQMQMRASAEIDKALQAIFDSVRQKGLAHEVH